MATARRHPGELRQRAVRLVRDLVGEDGLSVTEACRRIGEQLGISPDTLRGWAKQAAVDAGERPGTSTEERARIRALERENAELPRQRDPSHGLGFLRGGRPGPSCGRGRGGPRSR